MNAIPTASRLEHPKAAATKAAPARHAATSSPQSCVSLGCLGLVGDGRPQPLDELGGFSLSADRPDPDESAHIL